MTYAESQKHAGEIAELADEVAFWKFHAMQAYATTNGLDLDKPDNWNAVDRIFADARATERQP